MPQDIPLEAFDFEPGRRIGGKYIVVERLGEGWEGEVYHLREETTGIDVAGKFFYPHRNPNNRAVTFYAKKLDKLRDCTMLIRYRTQETCRYRGHKITFLVSELVQGELLSQFLARKHITVFEGVHLLYTLACGVEEIHARREYHGDLHPDNILINQIGLGFDIKLVDFFHWGRRTAEHTLDDLCDLIRLFYDAIGGKAQYKHQPPEAKYICCGLRRSLIGQRFRTVTRLRRHLETMDWS